ncbi:MAG: serine/threonine-protein kinase [Kibdelosporangium sp.]
MRFVAGRYAIRGELGRGGMGVVWRADDQVIGRQVALKELPAPPGLSANKSALYLERVLREARTAGRLNDPAVVTVFDVVNENGVTYIVMELVEAPTLADLIEERGLAAERVAAIGVQVLGALEAAHAAGIVHRDVKPSNIMVLPNDRVKLADFGIARAMDDPSLTMTGGIMGSPGYMAPELFSGSPPAPPSDLWALGATLFHAVEGRAPFTRETTAATMHAIMYDDPRLTTSQGPLGQAIMGLLAQPSDTRLTAAQARELLTAATSTGAAASPEPTQVVEQPTERMRPVQRDTSPREPWQDLFPEETALAAPTAVGWADEWTPPKKPVARRRLAVFAGGAVVLVGALVAVFLISPGSQQDEASAGPATESAVTRSEAQGETSEPAPPAAGSVPPSTVSSGPPGSVPTVTVTKPGQAPPSVPGQPPGQQPPVQEPPKPQRTLLAWVRYNHPKGMHVSATPGVPAPAGFAREYQLGALVAAAEPGTKRVYACQVSNGDDRFTSADAACEGQRVIAPLGYIFTSPPAGLKVTQIYRCNYNGGHFDSVHANCEGKTVEGKVGFAVS